jgi:hypothetical protein
MVRCAEKIGMWVCEPAATFGLASTPPGCDRIETEGLNTGLFDAWTATCRLNGFETEIGGISKSDPKVAALLMDWGGAFQLRPKKCKP